MKGKNMVKLPERDSLGCYFLYVRILSRETFKAFNVVKVGQEKRICSSERYALCNSGSVAWKTDQHWGHGRACSLKGCLSSQIEYHSDSIWWAEVMLQDQACCRLQSARKVLVQSERSWGCFKSWLLMCSVVTYNTVYIACNRHETINEIKSMFIQSICKWYVLHCIMARNSSCIQTCNINCNIHVTFWCNKQLSCNYRVMHVMLCAHTCNSVCNQTCSITCNHVIK